MVMVSVLSVFAHQQFYLLEQGPSSSMTTMDNRVEGGERRVATTCCIDYHVVFIILSLLWWVPSPTGQCLPQQDIM
jgi:hypothetical protein